MYLAFLKFFILYHFSTIILADKNYSKGIIFGLIGVILIGFQPIIISARRDAIDLDFPSELYFVADLYLFSTMTIVFEALFFLPIMLADRRMIKINNNKGNITDEIEFNLLNGWKNNKSLLIYVALTFSTGQILYTAGYQLSGAINGSLAQKATVIFSLLFGYIIMKEQISFQQIVFSFLLLFGLIISVTQGSFNLLEFNFGVLLLLILAVFWMLAHTLTKKFIFDYKNSTATQVVFIRNAIGAIILIIAFFFIFPLNAIKLLFNPINTFYYISMGIVYSTGLFFWYKTLSYLDTSKATLLISPTPIITAFFSVFLLGKIFTIFHLIGSIIVIISIIMIVKPEKNEYKKEI